MSYEETPIRFEGGLETFGSGIVADAELSEDRGLDQEQLNDELNREQRKKFGGFVTRRLQELDGVKL